MVAAAGGNSTTGVRIRPKVGLKVTVQVATQTADVESESDLR